MRFLFWLTLLLAVPGVALAQAPAEQSETPEGAGEEAAEAPPPTPTPADGAEAVEEPTPGIATGADERFPGGEPEEETIEGPVPVEEGEPEEVRELPPAAVQGPLEEEPPLLESWWFWVSIGAVVLGITLAIVVDVTTDDPAPSTPDEPEGSSMGLMLRF